MLTLVRRYWIEGVLHKSIWNQARLILNLEGRPDAVVRPCDLVLRRTGRSDTPILSGTPILDVYRQEQEELLLLGEPGSGKTTLLLEIAETLLKAAENDPSLPIPVVFNLSAWRKHHDRLDTWLVEQLNQDYLIPPKIGKRWVESGALLLLLDGLDEVAESRRAACIEAINLYRLNHQAVLRPMVVCCRTREYDGIPNLRLSGAVVVQPLTKQQVDGYLRGGGKALAGLRAVIEDEPALYRELFVTPLMLHVAIVTYEGRPADELRHSVSTEEQRRQLWNAYIERMFESKQEQEPQYEKELALDWLAWLGNYLTRKDLQKYLIEGMQPEDLPRSWQNFLARWLLPLLFASLSSAFLFQFIPVWPIVMLIVMMLVGCGIGYRRVIRLEPIRRFNVRNVRNRWKSLLIWAAVGVMVGMVFVALLMAVTRNTTSVRGFVMAFVAMLGSGNAVASGVGGAGSGIAFAMATKLFDESVLEDTVRPNEGVRHSLRTAAFAAVLGAMIGAPIGADLGLVFGWSLFRLPEWMTNAMWAAALGSVLGVMLGAVIYGGRTVVQHYLLRLLLWRSGRFPRDITAFLDWTAQRALVQRVGGGWRFVHRTLQARFAERYDAKYLDPRA